MQKAQINDLPDMMSAKSASKGSWTKKKC